MKLGWKIFQTFSQLVPVYKIKRRHRKYYYGIFSVSFALVVCLVLWKESDVMIESETAKREIELQLQESVLLNKGSGCQMPKLDPFSDEVMPFHVDVPKATCDGSDWVECYNGECKVTEETLHKMDDVICTYRDILHYDDLNYGFGPAVKLYGTETYRLNHSDHVKVSCTGTMVDSSLFRKLISVRWFGNEGALRPVKPKPSPPGRENTLDILIIAFDSASRNGFLRRMPKAYKFLTEDLDAVVLESYNIVGDGTPGALFPLLSGKTELDHFDPNIRVVKKNTFDPKNFIFHLMKEDGYRTAYFEDMAFIGTFNRRFSGFRSQPADHYLRSVVLEETDQGRKWWRGIKGRYCIGSTLQYVWMLNLTEQLFKTEGKHFCFTMIADISHEDFNLIATAQDDLVNFLKRFRDSGKLENTLLIVMGDHGSRFAGIRKTYQGKLEERLPFLSIVLPERLKIDRPEALSSLKANVDVLTTHFDLHATLLDVVGMREKWNSYKVPGADLPRAMTLLEPIPSSRSCGEAGVLPHWCACARWHHVPRHSPVYRRAASALGEFINKLIYEIRSLCMERRITSIEWVMRNGPNQEILNNKPASVLDFGRTRVARAALEYYQVKIIMSPGNAIFEGSMAYDVKKDTFRLSARDISRVDAYGDEPDCIAVTHPHLTSFCFCNGHQPVDG